MEVNDFTLLSLQLALMLSCAVLLGQVARRFGQPAMLGEIVGGVIIGVTVFGTVAPAAHEWLFLSSEGAAATRDAVIKVGMLFFLFVAGSEIDLSDVRRLGHRALAIGLAGTLLPLGVGVGLVYAIPTGFWGPLAEQHRFALALFIGLNLANSANPVLARILMDLGLLKREVGSIAMTATIVDDLVTWTVFALILGSIDTPGAMSGGSADPVVGLVAVALLLLVVVGGGRWLGPRALRVIRARTAWPAGFVGSVAVLVLVVSAAAEAIGVHAFLGAFLVGVAFSGHDIEHAEAHEVTARFALGFFAPIYFVSMAMGANFVTAFDLPLVLVLTVVACVTKLAGVLVGAWVSRMPIDRTTWAVAWGLNARGATGIVLAGVGRAAGIIDDRIFVALVTMAVLTTVVAGPMMKRMMSVQIPGSGDLVAPAPASAPAAAAQHEPGAGVVEGPAVVANPASEQS